MKPPRHPPDYRTTLASSVRAARERPDLLVRLFDDELSPTIEGRYLHWDELRFRTPPDGLTREEWWVALKVRRRGRFVPIEAMRRAYSNTGESHARPFGFVSLPSIEARLHRFDRTNVGRLVLTALGNDDAMTEYRVRQLIEEAISSSEIEGARPTTREVARQLVREGRTPESRDERMIVNNWRAMERILELHAEQRPLVTSDLLELHAILGEDALDVDGAQGVFRTREHSVQISDAEGNVWYDPPDADGVEQRIERLLEFAEGRDESTFLHPVVRAIVSHFWLGYEHPFRDGNGRMARALFYWCMLRHGYEMAEFLSISGPIDRSPKKYYMAFAYTEADDGDLTYFVLHQLDTIEAAIDELLANLEARATSMKRLERIVSESADLNHRQRALLQHAIRHPLSSYSIEGHATSHRVHYITAQRDIAELVRRGLLTSRQDGSKKRFEPSKSLRRKLTKAPG